MVFLKECMLHDGREYPQSPADRVGTKSFFILDCTTTKKKSRLSTGERLAVKSLHSPFLDRE